MQILEDGSAHANTTVSGGAITLDRSAATVHVGYSFDSKVQTLRMEGGADDGVSQGKICILFAIFRRRNRLNSSNVATLLTLLSK